MAECCQCKAEVQTTVKPTYWELVFCLACYEKLVEKVGSKSRLKEELELTLDPEEVMAERKPLCPYCNAEWTESMMTVYDVRVTSGCDSCGWGAGAYGTIDIKCESCDRLIYRKEFEAVK